MDQTLLLILIVVSLILSGLSVAHIARKAIMSFSPFIHITCLVGALIILALSILDLLIETNMFDASKNSSSLYFLSASLTSILSSYILLQVGFNFYQDYNFIKTLLMFAPIVVSVGVFALSVFIAIRMILNEGNILTESETKFMIITFILNTILGVLSILYGIIPLFSIRSQTRLRPQQTAVSIVHFSIVVTLFIAHFIVYTIITFHGPISDMGDNAIKNMILILIFPGCLFSPPRAMVKFIKRRVLGVEELAIGGDFRPNMLPNDYADRSTLPSNIQFVPLNDSSSNNGSSSNSNNSLSSSQTLTSEMSVITISSPTSPQKNTLNSASPKRNEHPIIRKSKTLPRSYLYNNSNQKPPRIGRSNTLNTFSTDTISTESDTSLYISKFISNSPDNGFSRLSRLSRNKLKEYIIGDSEGSEISGVYV